MYVVYQVLCVPRVHCTLIHTHTSLCFKVHSPLCSQDKQHLEIQLSELQGSMLDAAEEHKLKKTIKKQKALIRDLQQEVEFTRESGRQSSTMRALKHKLEEKEDVENSLNKTIKKLQNELSEMLELGEETERKKVELESKVSELSRQRNELELRMEEDQDEVEDLMQKQRQQANQVGETVTTTCGRQCTVDGRIVCVYICTYVKSHILILYLDQSVGASVNGSEHAGC